MNKTTFKVCLAAIALFWVTMIVAGMLAPAPSASAPAAAQVAQQAQRRGLDRESNQIFDECSKTIDKMQERNGRSLGETNGYDTMHYIDRYCSIPAQHLFRDGSDWRCYDQIKVAFSGTRAYRDLDMASGREWAMLEQRYCSNLSLR